MSHVAKVFGCVALVGLGACQTRGPRDSEVAQRAIASEGQPVISLIRTLGHAPTSIIPSVDGSKLYSFSLPGLAPVYACNLLVETDAKEIIRTATISGKCP